MAAWRSARSFWWRSPPWDLACAHFRYSGWGVLPLLVLGIGWLLTAFMAVALLLRVDRFRRDSRQQQ